MIFDNDKTLDGNIFMQNQVYKIIYDENIKTYAYHLYFKFFYKHIKKY